MSERKKAKGIRRTVRGWRAYGRVGGRFYSKSFPKDTALKVMKDWRQAERLRIRAEQLAGEVDQQPRGTLAGDVERYLTMVKSMSGLDQRAHELKMWVDALGGDRPRRSITAPEILAVMHEWRSAGLRSRRWRDSRPGAGFQTRASISAGPPRSRA